MIDFDASPIHAVLPVVTLPAELTHDNLIVAYAFTPAFPQPKPKLAAIDDSTVVDGVTPDLPQPKPK